MLRYLVQRILETIGVFVVLSFLVFLLFEMIPGDYVAEMEMNPAVSSRQIEELRSLYGLGEPFHVKYFHWLGQLIRGNLGYSFAQQRPATDLVIERLTNTVFLTAGALLLTLVLSVPLAILSAFHPGSRLDRAGRVLSLIGLSLPTVLAALILLYAAYGLGLFPAGRSGGPGHLFLASFTLALPLFAFFYRLLRLELLESLGQPFVVAAAARGLPDRKVAWHAFRNALNPVISSTGVLLGGLLSGAVVVERVFDWPGLGALTVSSILQRDLYVALNSVLAAALFVVASNLAADVLLAWNDPRVRYR